MSFPDDASPLITRLRRAATLEGEDWLVLLEASVWLVVVRTALRAVDFARVRDLVAGGWRPAAHSIDDPWPMIDRLHFLVCVAARYGAWRSKCLARSLVLQRLLARRGIDCALRVGVQLSPVDLEAHAWLEYDGQAIGEEANNLERFARLESDSE